MDNRLSLVDQAFYDAHRAAGQTEVMQAVWVYEHAFDLDELKRIHKIFGHGLHGRLIERSPLPFGRHRWVSDAEQSNLEIAECVRPREELNDWADEHAELPLDPEHGPGWHVRVHSFTDGSTAISFVASHYLIDGFGSVIAMVETLLGNTRNANYPPPHSRSRMRAIVQDARDAVRAAPETARAIVAAAKEARSHRREAAGASPASRPATLHGDDDNVAVTVPGITIYVDLDEWDARAKALSGVSNTLAAGLTAKLGEHLGFRHSGDGDVTVQLLLSNRTEGDTRAVAVSFARVNVDPIQVTTDLRDTRAATKQALANLREGPDVSARLAPLTPFTSKPMWRQLVDGALSDPDHPVVCSNFGDVGPVITRLDGTECEYIFARGVKQNVTRKRLERMGGQLQLLCLRVPTQGRFSITVVAYQPGAENTKAALRAVAARALAEFGLTGEIA